MRIYRTSIIDGLCHDSKFDEYLLSTKSSFLDVFSRKSVSVIPQNCKIWDWISFPEFGLAQDPILNKKVLIKIAWMSFPEVGLAHAPEIHQ